MTGKQLFILISFAFLFNSFDSFSSVIYSRANGTWNNGTNWSTVSHNGPACNCTPASSDSIFIAHAIILTKNLTNQGGNQNGISSLLHISSDGFLNGQNNYDIDIRSTGSLYLCGNLTAKNVIFSNGSSILICTSAQLLVNGNFENKNNSNNVTLNGSLNVNGSYYNGVGGVISGTGSININSGPVTNLGSTLGCAGANPCSGMPCSISGPCSTPLPVELISFDGIAYEKYIRIFWSTASEKNNDYFIIEKSLDAESYAELGKIKGSGNSNSRLDYAFRDYYPSKGFNFYRLKQFDYDGKVKTYGPVEVNFRSTDKLVIHPNPTAGKSLNVSLNTSDSQVLVEIVDLSGNLQFSKLKTFSSAKDYNFSIEEINSIPEGIYIFRVASESGMRQEKLMVTSH